MQSDTNALDAFVYGYGDGSARVTSRTSTSGPQLAASYFTPQQRDGLLQQLSYQTTSGAPLAQYGYQYDPNHNVTSFAEVDQGISTTYGYDASNQLLGGNTSAYTYDTNGNLTLMGAGSPLAGITADYTWDNEFDFVEDYWGSGGGAYHIENAASYDLDGNLLYTDVSPINAYDGRDRLIETITDWSWNDYSTFSYDGIGRLTQIVDRDQGQVVANHSYVWCGNVLCAELDNTTQIPASLDPSVTMPAPSAVYFSQGVRNMVYTDDGGLIPTSRYYVTDALGSVRELVQGSEVVAQYEYDPYGNQTVVSGTNAGNGFGFAGYFQHGASGLDFAQHRVYDPQLGRWLTQDPLGFGVALAGGLNPTDLNLYAYADNNPTSLRDPSGNCPACVLVGVGVVLWFGAWAPSDTAQAPARVDMLMLPFAGAEAGFAGGAIGCAADAAEGVEAAAIQTPYALEAQSASAAAQGALSEVQGGATIFRTGQLGTSMAGESQYWSLTSPLSPGYAAQVGLPGVTPDFIMGGTLTPGASVITNEAAALGTNAGGGIQVVVSPGGVTGLWFHMP